MFFVLHELKQKGYWRNRTAALWFGRLSREGDKSAEIQAKINLDTFKIKETFELRRE